MIPLLFFIFVSRFQFFGQTASGDVLVVNTNGSYSNLSVIIHDKYGNQITRSNIISYKSDELVMEISSSLPRDLLNEQVSVLIIKASEKPYEYGGVIRRITPESSFISLYKGKEKEGRSAKRYKFESPAVIDNLVFDTEYSPLHTPIRVDVVNISSSGILFNAKPDYFALNSLLSIKLKIGEKETRLIGEVISSQNKSDSEDSEYACKFIK